MADLTPSPSSPPTTRPAGSVERWDPSRGATPSAPPPALERRGAELWLDFLRRRALSIAAVTILTTAAAAAYAYTRPPVYEASSVVLVALDDGRSSDATAGEVFSSNDLPLSGELFLIQTSTELRDRVGERLSENGMDVSGGGLPSGTRVEFDIADASASAVVMTSTSPDPETAALVANTFADAYVEVTNEARQRRIADERAELASRVSQNAGRLSATEAAQRDHAYRTGGRDAGATAGELASIQASRDQTQTELDTRRATLQGLEAELARIPATAPTPNPAAILADDEGQLAVVRGQLAAARTERDQVINRYPDAAARDPRVTARIADLDREIARLTADGAQLASRSAEASAQAGAAAAVQPAYATTLRREIQDQRASIGALTSQLARLDGRLAKTRAILAGRSASDAAQAGAQVEQSQLAAARSVAEQALLSDRNRLREIADPEDAGYVRVLQSASPSGSPINPSARRTTLMGGILGLVLGIGLALTRSKLDNRIFSPDALRGLGYPVLATIPTLPGMKPSRLGRWVDRLRERRRRSRDHTGEGRRLAPSLVMLLAPVSAGAEAYRYLLANVLRATPEPPRVILVTSAGAEDGKSTTSANLALAAAASGRRTLLIDADLRRPSLHAMLDLPIEPGLTDRLAGREGDVFQAGSPWFSFIPAGSADASDAAHAAQELSTAAAAGALASLRERFDLVIIDSPPLLATADALYLAPAADAVLIVARAGRSREGELDHVLGSLEQVGAPATGFVFNGFDLSMAYGYSYRYRGYSKDGLYADYSRSTPALPPSLALRGDGASADSQLSS